MSVSAQVREELKRLSMDFSLQKPWLVFFSGAVCPYQEPVSADSFVIWVDGGVDALRSLYPPADLWLGDGDSEGEIPDCKKIVFEKDKDFLDGESVFFFLEMVQPSHVDFFGFFQGRWDMTFTHLFALYSCNSLLNSLRIFTERSILWYRSGNTHLNFSYPGRFSLIPMEELVGVSVTGGKYSMEGRNLSRGDGWTLSNFFSGDEIVITMKNEGRYLLEWEFVK